MRTRYLYQSADKPLTPADLEATGASHVASLLPRVKYRTFGESGQGGESRRFPRRVRDIDGGGAQRAVQGFCTVAWNSKPRCLRGP